MREETMSESERQYLLSKAKELGITHSNSISTQKLKDMIEYALEGQVEEKSEKPTFTGYSRKDVAKIRDEATKLIRCRVHCLNPAKQTWTGEVFTAGNEVVGTVSRYVPFDTGADGWHIEAIIVELLKTRRYQQFGKPGLSEVKSDVVDVNKNRLVPEFSIEILPPLTEDELKELQARQAALGSIDQDVPV